MHAHEKDAGQIEMRTVLAQPHRRGDAEQRLESPLGRLTLRHKMGREYFDAGQEYGGLVRHYYHAKGIQLDFSEGRSGSGLGVAPGKPKWLAAELERLETPLQRLDSDGFRSLKSLCVHERPIDTKAEPAAVIVLCELAQLLRKTGRR
jgi:hypothetical protein